MDLTQLFAALWTDYSTLNPVAKRIHALLESRGEHVVNDHIALRTFQHPRLNIAHLARPFEALGYVRGDEEYLFKEKKLRAYHWQHADPRMPKVFISELELEHFSPALRRGVDTLVDQIPEATLQRPDFSVSGRSWHVTHAEYLRLADESEYASWVAAFGFRANHFTVAYNFLKTFDSLADLNQFLKSNGHKLNPSGGEIKGTPSELLEQSSTLAEYTQVQFDDGVFPVPACYYEFARRYPMPDGRLYHGFIAASADKIFESTNRRS